MNEQKTTQTGRIRKLLNNERKFVRNPGANISVAARIIGQLSEDRLRHALKKVRIMHPLVGSRVVFDDNHDAWFHTDGVPQLPLRVVTRNSENQWFDEIVHEQLIPFDYSTGPLIRFVLMHSPEVSDLVVFCQHSICDGSCLAFLIHDILTHLADPALEAKPLPMPPPLSPKNFPKEASQGFLEKYLGKLMVNRMNAKWKKERQFFDYEDFLNIHKAYWQNHTYRIVLLQLTNDETDLLTSVCREKGVTVNSVLCTAFLAAYHDVCGPFKGNQRNVAVPVNLRNRIEPPVGDVFSLYVGSVMFRFNYDPRKGFWENTYRFHKAVQKDLNNRKLFSVFYALESLDPTLMDALLNEAVLAKFVTEEYSRFEKLSAFARDSKNTAIKLANNFTKSMPGMVMTNLSRLDFPEKYGDLQLDRMFFAPSASEYFPLALGALATRGKLTLTANYIEEASPTATMVEIRDRALKYLGLASQ